jgi:hypothetical protein
VASVGKCFTNTTWQETWTLGTAMVVKFATADTIYSRLNSSILSIEDLTPSDDTYSFSLTDFMSTFQRIFASDIDSQGDLVLNSTTTWLLNYALNAIAGGVVSPIEVLRSWLVTPLIMFQPNSYTNPLSTTVSSKAPISYLPDFDANADLAKSGWRASIAPWTAILFFALAFVIFFGCLFCLLWSVTIQGPPTTRFPLIDFASRAISKGFTEDSLATVLATTANGDEKRVREKLCDKVVYLGDVGTAGTPGLENKTDPDGQAQEWDGALGGKIGFSLNSDVVPLKAGKAYE